MFACSFFLMAVAASHFALFDLCKNSLPRNIGLHEIRDRPVFFADMIEFQNNHIGFAAIHAGMNTQILANALASTANVSFFFLGGFFYIRLSILEVKIPLIDALTIAAVHVPLANQSATKVEFNDGLELFADDALTSFHE